MDSSSPEGEYSAETFRGNVIRDIYHPPGYDKTFLYHQGEIIIGNIAIVFFFR